jgi:beta-glucanase (GH16 family)
MQRYARLALGFVVVALIGCGSDGEPRPANPALPAGSAEPRPWVLTWSDEFDGAAGAAVDGRKWVADTGGKGWGNNEREYYTPGSRNAALDGDGRLVITARAESDASLACWYGPCRYSSARLKTTDLLTATYGRFEARIKLPRGQGLWPAFWLLGDNCAAVDWPRCGEIDVIESVGQQPDVVFGTAHGPGYSGGEGITRNTTIATPDDFHVYAMEWTPGQLRWLVDDKEFHRVTPSNLPAGATWVFDHPFFLILNVAVGGGRPGDPDATTTFPQQMVVDYVRVYSQ